MAGGNPSLPKSTNMRALSARVEDLAGQGPEDPSQEAEVAEREAE